MPLTVRHSLVVTSHDTEHSLHESVTCQQEASKSGPFATKKVDASVNQADLMTMPIPKARIEQLVGLMGHEFVSATTSTSKGQATMTQGY